MNPNQDQQNSNELQANPAHPPRPPSLTTNNPPVPEAREQVEPIYPSPLPQPTPIPPATQQGPGTNAQYLPDTESPVASPHSSTSAGIIVLQWLTYAFWGWTVLIMSFLTYFVLAAFIDESDSNSFIIYLIAAILVLLPISLVADVFYSKHEPHKKTGASSIVMVIHAVIFALFGIGALIGMVFSLVTLFTSSSETTGTQISLYSAGIIFVLYAATFLRTLNPPKFPWIKRVYVIFMVVTVGIIAALGIIGPAAQERASRDDRLIESALPIIVDEVDNYTADNNSLPSDLSQVDLENDAKKLVNDRLIEYKPNTKPASSNFNGYSDFSSSSTNISSSSARKIYYYQLCVNYKEADKDDSSYRSRYSNDNEGYDTYVSTYGHEAGEVCYKVMTRDY